MQTSCSFMARYRKPLRWITARGLVRATADALVLEWQEHVLRTDTAKRTVGPPQALALPIDALDTLDLRRSLLGGPRLVLRARSLETFAGLPFASGEHCSLRLARGDALRARELRTSVHEAIAESVLRRVSAEAGAGFDVIGG